MTNCTTRAKIGLLVTCLLLIQVATAAPPPVANEAAAAAGFANGHYQWAIVQYQRLLHDRPNDVGYRTKLAESYEITGDLEQARLHASKVLNQRSNNIEALLLMGRIHGRQQDWAAAKSYYERATRADKNNAMAQLGYSQALMELGDSEAAETAIAAYRQLTGISGSHGESKQKGQKPWG